MRFLFFGAHPDDVEMSCAGTILKLKKAGHWVGIIDLTKGELGTLGTSETRKIEAENAAKFLGVDYRSNLDLGDGNIASSEHNRTAVAEAVRLNKPDFVFCNATRDRHIDHGYAAQLVIDACFLSGLAKYHNKGTAAHRPKNIFHYIQDYYLEPSFVVDISDFFNLKIEAVLTYQTQFYQKNNKIKPKIVTPISSPEFLEFFSGRALQMGRLINTKYGEGFISNQPINLEDMNWFNKL